MIRMYDERLTDEAKRAVINFKKAVYELYVNYDQEVMNVGKPIDNLWQLHNDIQDWAMVDGEGIPLMIADVPMDDKDHEVMLEMIADEERVDEDIPLIDKVARVLSELRSDTSIDVVGSLEYDYTARDVIKYIRPLLNDEKVMYDVFHNPDNEFLSLIRIY